MLGEIDPRAGLVLAGATRWYGMSEALALMPWSRERQAAGG